MRKVNLYIATSLDGFIATKEGKVDWLIDSDPDHDDDQGRDYGYHQFYDTIDTTLMGYNTYRQILDFGVPFPYPDKTNYVFSRNHTKEEDLPVEFISSDIIDFTRKLKQAGGKDIWLVGGGQINRLLLNADLIDLMTVSIQPVILGEGLPLFGSGAVFKRFKVVESKSYHGIMAQIIMERKHDNHV